jgi:leucyl-tRNA synthetase
MFLGPFDSSLPWSTEGIIGSRRFIEKVWRVIEKVSKKEKTPVNLEKLLHKTIKKVTEDIIGFNFNTAISSMMIFMNELEKSDQISIADFKLFLQILAPFAPHVVEDLWKNFGEKKSIHISPWPKYDKNKIQDDVIKIAVQVNGRVRTEIEFPSDALEADIKDIVLDNDAVKNWVKGGEIKRFIYIKNKLVNIVV